MTKHLKVFVLVFGLLLGGSSLAGTVHVRSGGPIAIFWPSK